MIYLTQFEFPSGDTEFDYLRGIKRKCYDTYYPFRILCRHELERLDFEPITILYGTNGSGKSTALNVIAEKLQAERKSLYNRSNFYEAYLEYCTATMKRSPEQCEIITSDDVFEYMQNIRKINAGIDEKREELFEDYLDSKYADFRLNSLAEYETLKKVNLARSKTQSQYVRRNLMDNVREYSNGESALLYFEERIQENGLYLLDEPENSLSPSRQMELALYLENAVRFFQCQLIIATHSPFLLSLRGARIYDLNADPVDIKKWSRLDEMRRYYDFFMEHQNEFERTE